MSRERDTTADPESVCIARLIDTTAQRIRRTRHRLDRIVRRLRHMTADPGQTEGGWRVDNDAAVRCEGFAFTRHPPRDVVRCGRWAFVFSGPSAGLR